MANKYRQPSLSSAVRFQKAPLAGLEMSKLNVNPRVYTTYNAGDIVPIYYEEVLPHSTFSVDVEFINRLLSATIKPTMGAMQLDLFAFFVPNRIINESWKNIQGENSSGYWSAPEVELAPLWSLQGGNQPSSISIPPMSVADYYGFGTQAPIPSATLAQFNDLKFKGYLSIYNNYFRDENYQPPINFSKLNVYQGFLLPKNSSRSIVYNGDDITPSINMFNAESDGNSGFGSVVKSVYGEGVIRTESGNYLSIPATLTDWSALDRPLKANKLHDAFTSVLPSPQKGPEVFFGIAESAPVTIDTKEVPSLFPSGLALQLKTPNNIFTGSTLMYDMAFRTQSGSTSNGSPTVKLTSNPSLASGDFSAFLGSNLKGVADLSQATGVSINDLRRAAAIQQVYEMLGRNGSRYLESLRSFFGIETENPFKDIPTQLGHIRRELDLYQVAQTSSSVEGETPQGNLSGFGYTAKEGSLFTYTALEHGYVHYLLVVRQRNIYPALLMPDNFRKSTLDWYLPQLANIGEQPVRLANINPFAADGMERTIGFQEAWWEYRYSPDRVSGYCRTGLNDSLDIWTYADEFDASFDVVDGEWLKSNAQEVLDRTLAVTSDVAPQFIIMLEFKTSKQLPMPIYSVPGLDVL